MKIVHLPFYDNNPYQTLLMEAQRRLGHEVIQGGGGGNFFRTALCDWKADMLHFHWLHPYLLRSGRGGSILRASRFLMEVALLKRRGAAIFWTIHNIQNHDRRFASLEAFFSRRFARLTDANFAHSRAAARLAAECFRLPLERITVIPHGNYSSVYPNTVSIAEARAQLGIAAEARVLLFLGRLQPYKGLEALLDAYQAIGPTDAVLLVAGCAESDAFRAQLEQKIAQIPGAQLHHGFVADDRLQLYFNAADAVVFPFTRILTSGSVVLAMSFGKALILPDVEVLREIVPAEGAIWFEPASTESLQVALVRALQTDPAISGEVNRRVAAAWSWESIAVQTLRASPSRLK